MVRPFDAIKVMGRVGTFVSAITKATRSGKNCDHAAGVSCLPAHLP
jgi:hypothetical protein